MKPPPFHIPETFLREVWREQRFSCDQLHTADGRRVIILSPGTPNEDAGPDFIGAEIRIGATLFTGDVELHRDASAWDVHRHSQDPHYNRVVLHVVMTVDPLHPPARTASKRLVPLLLLHPYLDPVLLSSWESTMIEAHAARRPALVCTGRNTHVPIGVMASWMEHLAAERMEFKIRRCEERLKQLIDEKKMVVREPYPRYYGSPDEIPVPHREYTQRDFMPGDPWEQLLYEGVMDAMGFSKNRIPFQTLARSLRLEQMKAAGLRDTPAIMALMLGVAGLLPSSRRLPAPECRAYVRTLRRRWRELRSSFKGECLHEGDWLFFRLHPYNFPTARLAGVCFLLPGLFAGSGLRRIIQALKAHAGSPAARLRAMRELFSFTPDEFWRHHHHFFADRPGRGIALGTTRIHDMLVNSVLPTALLYARIFADGQVRTGAQELLGALPLLQENSVTRLLSRELPSGQMLLGSVTRQQGALQLFNAYCARERCSECAIGEALA